MKTLKQIIKNLNNATTLEEVDKSSKEASEYYTEISFFKISCRGFSCEKQG